MKLFPRVTKRSVSLRVDWGPMIGGDTSTRLSIFTISSLFKYGRKLGVRLVNDDLMFHFSVSFYVGHIGIYWNRPFDFNGVAS